MTIPEKRISGHWTQDFLENKFVDTFCKWPWLGPVFERVLPPPPRYDWIIIKGITSSVMTHHIIDIIIHTIHHADLWSSSDFYRDIDLHVWFVARPVSLVHPMVQLDRSLLFIFWTTFTFTTLSGFINAGRKQEKKKTEEKEKEERNCRPPPHHTSQNLQITNPRHTDLSQCMARSRFKTL